MLLGNVFVFGQRPPLEPLHFEKPDLGFAPAAPGYLNPPLVFKLLPEHVFPWKPNYGLPYNRRPNNRTPRISELFAQQGDSLKMLAPDRMPCVVPDLSRLEPMPVRRGKSFDPMPVQRQRSRHDDN
jgi:hypothetical protein